jgi:hypothetical protein
MNFGFIITRHVNSPETNRYWNQNVKLIRSLYPYRQIVIIDDNSVQEFVKADVEYNPDYVTTIQSEYPGRGELLPYIYFYKNKWFDSAVMIHDSVFFHRRIPFENINIPVIPLWSFPSDKGHINTNLRLADTLNNTELLKAVLKSNNKRLNKRWNGFFGSQCYIKHRFLTHIMEKYNMMNLLTSVTCREDIMSLERITGLISNIEMKSFIANKSLLGSIFNYQQWGYNYNQYEDLFKRKRKVIRPVVKVWTGR